MNKQDIVVRMAEKSGLSNKAAEGALDALTAVIGETLAGGDEVKLVGFGTFAPKSRAARDGRNPQTGKKIKIPAAVVPAFSPSALLKQAVAAKAAPKKKAKGR